MKKLLIGFVLLFTQVNLMAQKTDNYIQYVNPLIGTQKMGHVYPGATVPFGANKVLVSYVRKDDRTAANQDAHQWALGYLHSLSKRTDLYAAYAKISNSNGAGYTVGSAIEAGSGDSAFQFGTRHSF